MLLITWDFYFLCLICSIFLDRLSNSTFLSELHYGDVIVSAIASQITSLTIVYSTVYLDADQRKHQSSASLDFVWGIHRGPVNYPHKWPVTRKMFPFDDVIMRIRAIFAKNTHRWGLYITNQILLFGIDRNSFYIILVATLLLFHILIQVMVWCWIVDKSFLEPIMTKFTDAYRREPANFRNTRYLADEMYSYPTFHMWYFDWISLKCQFGWFPWSDLIKHHTRLPKISRNFEAMGL